MRLETTTDKSKASSLAHQQLSLEGLTNNDSYICFPAPCLDDFPEEVISQRTSLNSWLPGYVGNSQDGLDNIQAIKQLNPQIQEALSRLTVMLLSGEESAIHVFYNEGKRIENDSALVSQRLFYDIAHEEEQHERLLKYVYAQLPKPDDFHAIRSRSRKFFIRLKSQDPAIQFARIASLDSCVCKVMSSLLETNCKISEVPILARIAQKIRLDESRHVKASRKHIDDLGMVDEERRLTDNIIRHEIIQLFESVGDSYEALGIEPDRLFKNILRGSK